MSVHVENKQTWSRSVHVDYILLFISTILVSFGLIMVYSTTGIIPGDGGGDGLFFVKRQAVAAVLGFVLMYCCSRASLEQVRRLSGVCFPFAVGLLVLTLIPGLGDRAGGAQRWITLPLVRFQPGEISKFLFVVYLAGYLSRREMQLPQFSVGLLKPIGFLAVIGALLLVQPDFGSTVVLALVCVAMAGAAGVRLRYVALCGVALFVGAAILVILSPYRLNRFLSFLSPWEDPSGRGYQLIQSLIAVGTGEVSGVGLGGSQQKLSFLPAAHTDFIFAVISEELGFLGGVAVIGLFLLFLWRGVRMASRLAEDTFAFSLAVGLTMLIVVPALLNVGVVIGLLPTKGMVLPFVGYGGSALVVSLASVGLLLAISRESEKPR